MGNSRTECRLLFGYKIRFHIDQSLPVDTSNGYRFGFQGDPLIIQGPTASVV